MKPALAALLLTLVVVPQGSAQLTNPISYTWIATSCRTWNCAAAALVLADGDRHVIVLPTADSGRPWVVLRRVEEGSIYIPEDEPFVCEVFETVTLASAQFSATDRCHVPTILSVPDGRAVLVGLRKCDGGKRRAIR